MKTKLLVFGDSWPYGGELDFSKGEQPFGKIIAQMKGYEYCQFSECATGVPHMINQLQHAISRVEVSGSTALFCLSSPSRSIYYDKKWQSIHINDLNSKIAENYFKFIHSPEIEDFHLNCYIQTLQNICNKYKIKDYYVSCWSKINLYMPGIDKNKFLGNGNITLTDVLGCRGTTQVDPNIFVAPDDIGPPFRTSDGDIINRQHPSIFPNDWHPNQLGHQQIAEHLVNWIE